MDTKRFNLIEHYRNISNHLLSQYRLSSTYGQRGSKGQLREDFLTKTLEGMSHDNIRLVKGEICDSSGRRSPEFDIIISYLSNAIKLFGSDITHVIPVETVLSVIEVKSILSKKDILKFNQDLTHLNSFDRFYTLSPMYEQLCKIKGTNEYAVINDRTIPPNDHLLGISPILGCMVAFEAPNTETVQGWLSDLETELNFAQILVINRFLATRDKTKNSWQISEKGVDSFSLFACIYSEFLTNTNDREYHVQTDTKRYIDLAIANTDETKKA